MRFHYRLVGHSRHRYYHQSLHLVLQNAWQRDGYHLLRQYHHHRFLVIVVVIVGFDIGIGYISIDGTGDINGIDWGIVIGQTGAGMDVGGILVKG